MTADRVALCGDESASDPVTYRFERLNLWPGAGEDRHWLDGWGALDRSRGPWDGCVGSVEVAADRSCYGAAVAAVRGDGSVDVVTLTCGTVGEALGWLDGYGPWLLLCGVSLRGEVEGAGSWVTRPVGVRETGQATPWLGAAVKRGRVRHDHAQEMSVEVSRSAVTDAEGGIVLSARRSTGPIPTLKAAAWAAWAAASEPVVEPAIW